MAKKIQINADGRALLIENKVKESEQDICCGCTLPYSPNYNPNATHDDGSCLTCCNQGKCVYNDTDCGLNCLSLTQDNGCNNNGMTELTPNGFCIDCCDAFCFQGCPPGIPAPNDCSPTVQQTFTIPAEQTCCCSEIIYYSCEECPNQGII